MLTEKELNEKLARVSRVVFHPKYRTIGASVKLLRESLPLCGKDYVSMIACQDEVDVAILSALYESGATGRQSGELAVQLDIDHRDVSRKIHRMNKRMAQEIGENIITKHGHKWKLIPQLRRDFVVMRG